MTFFLCGFKYFHGSLPDSPKQRLPQVRTGKVRPIELRTLQPLASDDLINPDERLMKN
jgi:hypothetical protein